MVSVKRSLEKYKWGIIIAICALVVCGILSFAGNQWITSRKSNYWVENACEFVQTNADFQSTYGTVKTTTCEEEIQWQGDTVLVPIKTVTTEKTYLVWVSFDNEGEYSEPSYVLNIYSVEEYH